MSYSSPLSPTNYFNYPDFPSPKTDISDFEACQTPKKTKIPEETETPDLADRSFCLIKEMPPELLDFLLNFLDTPSLYTMNRLDRELKGRLEPLKDDHLAIRFQRLYPQFWSSAKGKLIPQDENQGTSQLFLDHQRFRTQIFTARTPNNTISLSGKIQASATDVSLVALSDAKETHVIDFSNKNEYRYFKLPFSAKMLALTQTNLVTLNDYSGMAIFSVWDLNLPLDQTPRTIRHPVADGYSDSNLYLYQNKLVFINQKNGYIWDLNLQDPAPEILFGEDSIIHKTFISNGKLFVGCLIGEESFIKILNLADNTITSFKKEPLAILMSMKESLGTLCAHYIEINDDAPLFGNAGRDHIDCWDLATQTKKTFQFDYPKYHSWALDGSNLYFMQNEENYLSFSHIKESIEFSFQYFFPNASKELHLYALIHVGDALYFNDKGVFDFSKVRQNAFVASAQESLSPDYLYSDFLTELTPSLTFREILPIGVMLNQFYNNGYMLDITDYRRP